MLNIKSRKDGYFRHSIGDIQSLFCMVKDGFPFVFGAFFLAVAAAALYFWVGGIVFFVLFFAFALLTAFMAYFFRDPDRTVPDEENIIISAADGKVTRVEERADGQFVSVFLSPFDVHVNRAPIAGKVTTVEYVRGKKNPATSNEASLINERNSITIENATMTVVCTQIAGIVARRIVCWSKAGDELALGEKFGLIKFSSRTDLLMPKKARVLVKVGDRVRGGETIIARID